MKKNFFCSIVLLTIATATMAQSITVRFTARSTNGQYHPFESVRVENETQGWSQRITYPDTVIVLGSSESINVAEAINGPQIKVYPNPFDGHTTTEVQISEDGKASISIMRINGSVVSEYDGFLKEGIYKLNVSLSEPQVAFLCVSTRSGRSVAKMVNTAAGDVDKIDVSYLEGYSSQTKAVGIGPFNVGDQMSYKATYTSSNGMSTSNTVSQSQTTSELITLFFTESSSTTLPTVTTSTVSNITSSSADCGGNVTNDGNATVTARGVCWSISHNPTTSNSNTANGSGTGSFTSSITGLSANTTYYVRAYATNSAGTAYGEEHTFTTSTSVSLPTVTTSTVSSITSSTATCGGNVTNGGNATVTARGVCWSTSHSPTTSNSHTTNGTGTGTFTSSITGLSASTTYYVRAYATNSAGTAYGSEVSFTTSNATSGEWINLGLPSGLLWYSVNLGATTPEGYGNYYAWGETNTKSNYSWNTYSYGSSDNTLTKYCNNSSYGLNGFTDNLTTLQSSDDAATAVLGNGARIPTKAEWQELLSNTTATWTTQNGVYGRKLTATNGNSIFLPAAGFIEGSLLGYNGTCGWYWSASLEESDPRRSLLELYSSDAQSVATFYRYVGLSVRAVHQSGSSVPLPTVTTSTVSSITSSTATCGGNVTNSGGATVTARGVCWSTSHNPTTSNSHTTNSSGTGSFTSSITGLSANTTYYVRAYATNSAGTAYGSEISFTTTATPSVGGFDQNGASNAVFTVASGRTVHFSRGNLQYRASTGTWRFAEHQYDYVGSTNSNISSSYSGWIDLFGWGTSGWNSGANAYQPWATSTSNSDYYPGESYTNNLTGTYANADWGVYNAISNGGNQAGIWRTLTKDEWCYLLESRAASTINGVANSRYAKAVINGTKGVILFPDIFTMPSNMSYPSGINTLSEQFNNNTYTESQWSQMESAGCIFLPAAGLRYGTEVSSVGTHGYYWSSTYNYVNGAWGVVFMDGGLYVSNCARNGGRSVRLVRD